MRVGENTIRLGNIVLKMEVDAANVGMYQQGFQIEKRKVFKELSAGVVVKVYRLEMHKLVNNKLVVYSQLLDVKSGKVSRVTIKMAKDLNDAKKDFSAKVYGRNKAGYVDCTDSVVGMNSASSGALQSVPVMPVIQKANSSKVTKSDKGQGSKKAVATSGSASSGTKKDSKATGGKSATVGKTSNSSGGTSKVSSTNGGSSNTSGNALASVVTDANGVQILKRESLNFFNPQNNNNKFYIIELQQLPDGDFEVSGTYGRVGTEGTVFEKKYSSLSVAESEYEKKLNSKLAKGYVKVKLATHSLGSNANKLTVDSNVVKTTSSKSTLDSQIQKLVTQLYDEANKAVSMSLSGSISSDIKAPLGNLSPGAIAEGREIINDLGDAIKKGYSSQIERLSIQYYNKIPRIMPANLRIDRSWILGTNEKLNEELDTLQLYEDTLRMLPAMVSHDTDAKYVGLHCDIRHVTDSKTLEYVRKKVCNSIASNHHYSLEVINVYEINQHNAPKFDSSPGNVRNLFHGSRSCNLVGILSSHLKMPNSLPNVQKTGAMFGPGIYFASESSKSFNYSDCRFGGGRNKYDTAFLFIVEVALGKIKKVDRATNFMEPPAGYDSVKGCKGISLYNDEYIVYKENRARIKYLVELKKI